MAQPSSFVLTPQELESRCVNGISDLYSLIDRKVSLGSAPISKINVGAAGLGSSGKVFLGINVELPGLPLHHSIHAVQFLVTNLALNSEPMLTHLAVSAKDSVFEAPCGHCRQFLQEIREAPTIKILRMSRESENPYEYVTLKSLLPHPEVLVPREWPFLLDPRDNKLTLLHPYPEVYELVSTALAAANKSFAPYSKSPSGVALKDRDNNVYRGWYMETTAFNPISLGPVQAALVDFVMRRGPQFNDIVEAVLVENQDAMVRQDRTADMILKTIANPNCIFSVFYCH